MAREAIERIRDALAVVEAVAARMPDAKHLNLAREALYAATTALVTAARAATGPPIDANSETEDEEKRALLHSATSVLRASDDCLTELRTALASDAIPFPSAALATGGESEHVTLSSRTARHGRHTLSMLGRKATSLTCLRETFERDNGLPWAHDVISEDVEEVEEERLDGQWSPAPAPMERSTSDVDAPSLLVRRGISSPPPLVHLRTPSAATSVSLASTVLPSTAFEGSASAASRPMVREESARTSNSTTAASSVASSSGASDASADTSPHSSFTSTRQLGSEVVDWESREGRLAKLLDRDYEPREISFNADGAVVGGTLPCLVERLTLHDTIADARFSSTFFLTFRLFSTASALCLALISRYDLAPPAGHAFAEDELRLWREKKAVPVRLRVFNVLKTWLENYWQASTDGVILDPLRTFVKNTMAATLSSGAVQRLSDLIEKRRLAARGGPSLRQRALSRMASSDALRSPVDATHAWSNSAGGPPPPPLISRGLLAGLRSAGVGVVVIDIDPLELARQLTIIESRLYCAIKPEELIGQEFSNRGTTTAVNVKAMSALSTRLTGWISETILNESDARKRTQLLKYFIRLADVRFYATQHTSHADLRPTELLRAAQFRRSHGDPCCAQLVNYLPVKANLGWSVEQVPTIAGSAAPCHGLCPQLRRVSSPPQSRLPALPALPRSVPDRFDLLPRRQRGDACQSAGCLAQAYQF